MSITAARGDNLAVLRQTRTEFWSYAVGGVALCFIIQILPKFADSTMLRLGLTLFFFCGLATTVCSIGKPLSTYLHARIDLGLEDAGGENRALGHAVIDALERYLQPFMMAGLVAVGCIALRVFAAWPMGAVLAKFAWLLQLVQWAAIAAIPVQLVTSTSRMTEVSNLYRSFKRQLAFSGFHLASEAEAAARAEQLNGPPVAVTGRYSFSSGGIDWSWSDFQKNAIIFGQTGSGKTITILNSLLDGLLASANGEHGGEKAAALILDPKGDYEPKIQRLCTRIGRADSLRILDPNNLDRSVRFNPFDNEDDALEISERFAGVLALLGMKNSNDTFFIDMAKTFLRHAVAILRASEPVGMPPSFAEISRLATEPLAVEARLFIVYAKALLARLGEAPSPARIRAMAAQTKVLREAIELLPQTEQANAPWAAYFRAWRKKEEELWQKVVAEVTALAPLLEGAPAPSLGPGSEAGIAAQFLANTWLDMPDKTRGSVQSQLVTMIDPFLTEPYRTLFSGCSTLRLGDVLEQGLIFYVFMPRDERSAMSKVVNTLIKLEYFRQVLLRGGKSRPSLFFCDEFQAFFSSDDGRGDGPFFERSRASFHANVVATQNLAGLLRDVPKEETIKNFLGNCAIKFFLRNTEGKTNEFASKEIFGEYDSLVVTAGRTTSGKGGREGMSHGASLNEALQRSARVPPERFTQLTIPDQPLGINFAEAMVHLGSRAAVEIHRLKFKVHPLTGE